MDTVSYVSEAEFDATVAKAEARSKITKQQNRAAAHAAIDARHAGVVTAILCQPYKTNSSSGNWAANFSTAQCLSQPKLFWRKREALDWIREANRAIDANMRAAIEAHVLANT